MAKKVVRKSNTFLYIYVLKTQRTAFEKIAKQKGTTLSALMRNVLEDYLSKEDKKSA